MNNTKLVQLIRESINEYIREIDEAGNVAALEAKMNKTQEAIELREKKMNMEGIDEAYHDMIDKDKMKELSSEVKALKKSLAKYEKQLAKLKNKGAKKVEDTEEKEIVDEMEDPRNYNDTDDAENMNADSDYEAAYDSMDVDLDEYTLDPSAGPQLEEARFKKGTDIGKKGKGFAKIAKSAAKRYGSEEEGKKVAGAILKKVLKKEEKEPMNESFLHMQKLAGLITESEYKEKIGENYENDAYEDDDFDLSKAFRESPNEHSYNEVLDLFENYEDEEILDAFKLKFPEGESISKNDYYNFAMDFIDDMSETAFIKANWVSLTDDDVYEKAGLV